MISKNTRVVGIEKGAELAAPLKSEKYIKKILFFPE